MWSSHTKEKRNTVRQSNNGKTAPEVTHVIRQMLQGCHACTLTFLATEQLNMLEQCLPWWFSCRGPRDQRDELLALLGTSKY